MSERVKCLRCDNRILEVTAKVNQGLCGHCKRDAERESFQRTVRGWIENPETLPGTHGNPEPIDMGLSLAANQIRARLYPREEDRIENYCHDVFDAAHAKWHAKGSRKLSLKEKVVLSVESFHGEVLNGGIEQYLFNESGAFAQWAEEGFRLIGIPAFAEVMKEVGALFPGHSIPECSAKRSDILLRIEDEVFEKIEKPFWERYFGDQEEIRRKLFTYLVGGGGDVQ